MRAKIWFILGYIAFASFTFIDLLNIYPTYGPRGLGLALDQFIDIALLAFGGLTFLGAYFRFYILPNRKPEAKE